MTNPQIKTQAKLHIYDGISVETVKQQGSDGQKIAVPLFDTNGNGKLEGMEVDRMNRCTFKSEKNKLTIFENKGEDKQEITEIKYNNTDDLYAMYDEHALNNLDMFSFGKYTKDGVTGYKHYFGSVANYAKRTIDLIHGKITVEGAKGDLYGRNVDLTVKNSDISKIGINGGKVKLQNVKDKGLIYDNATEIKTDGKTAVDADINSKVKISQKAN